MPPCVSIGPAARSPVSRPNAAPTSVGLWQWRVDPGERPELTIGNASAFGAPSSELPFAMRLQQVLRPAAVAASASSRHGPRSPPRHESSPSGGTLPPAAGCPAGRAGRRRLGSITGLVLARLGLEGPDAGIRHDADCRSITLPPAWIGVALRSEAPSPSPTVSRAAGLEPLGARVFERVGWRIEMVAVGSR